MFLVPIAMDLDGVHADSRVQSTDTRLELHGPEDLLTLGLKQHVSTMALLTLKYVLVTCAYSSSPTVS